MTLKNKSAPLLSNFKFWASFRGHRWIRNEVTVETPNLGQNRRFFVPNDLEIWHMTYLEKSPYRLQALCIIFVAIGEFKLELHFGNAQFGSISPIISPLTLKFEIWLGKTIGHPFYAIWSFVHHFVAIGEFKLELQSWNAKFSSKSAIILSRANLIKPMILKNSKAFLLNYFKLCASFRINWWIYIGEVIFRIHPVFTDIIFSNGNNYWQFHNDVMTGTLWKGVTDGRTDRRTDRSVFKSCLVAGKSY